ncbi:MAG: hypothetical protein ABEJ44_04145 [Halanaeroarchaeum sp.]
MDRRAFLETGTILGAAALGGYVALNGCLGSDEERFTLDIAHYNFGENDAGYLETWVVVTNVGNERQRGTLYVNSELNGEPITRVRNVDLAAHQTAKYTVTYDVKYDNVRSYSPEPELVPPTD